MSNRNRIVQIASGRNIIQSTGGVVIVDGSKSPAPIRLSGRQTEKLWTPGLVRGVSFSGIGMLTCVPGKSPRLKVTTDEVLLPYVSIGSSGGWLKISLDLPAVLSSVQNCQLQFRLESPTMRKVDVSGAVQISLPEISESPFSLCAEGAASIFLSGMVDSCMIWASGSAHIQGRGLCCRTLDVNASGASSVEITALDELAAHASGAAYVIIHGSPAMQKAKIEGIAEIVTVGEHNGSL